MVVRAVSLVLDGDNGFNEFGAEEPNEDGPLGIEEPVFSNGTPKSTGNSGCMHREETGDIRSDKDSIE